MAETIVAAAIRHGDLTISAPPPARHHTLIHPFFDLTQKRTWPEDQGFLTSTGRFVGRAEALRIVLRSGQPRIEHPSRNDNELYSEDLW